MANAYGTIESGMISIDKLIWRYGRPSDIWVYHADKVGQFIRRNKLRPVPNANLHFVMDELAPISGARVTAKSKALQLIPRPFPGGLRFSHLHFREKIYALNEKQWKSFSRSLIKDFQAKLDRSETVSFQHMMELSDVMTGM